jgi:hypothetical protein
MRALSYLLSGFIGLVLVIFGAAAEAKARRARSVFGAVKAANAEINRLAARLQEAEAAREQPASGPLTLEQIVTALVELLQDEPEKFAKAAFKRIGATLSAAWGQRRRDGVPTRSQPPTKRKGKNNALNVVLKEVENNINDALGSLFKK